MSEEAGKLIAPVNTNPYNVKVGDVWQSADKRRGEYFVLVTEVRKYTAVVTSLEGKNQRGIGLHRFCRHNGYRPAALAAVPTAEPTPVAGDAPTQSTTA